VSSAVALVDTGVLVALLNRKEEHPAWAVEKSRTLPAPFLTCEPVLTETYFLVSTLPGGALRFFQLLQSGMLEVDFSVIAEREPLGKLIRKYEDLPMSLADACLVRLAELHPAASVLTLDSHFRVYRKHGSRFPSSCREARPYSRQTQTFGCLFRVNALPSEAPGRRAVGRNNTPTQYYETYHRTN